MDKAALTVGILAFITHIHGMHLYTGMGPSNFLLISTPRNAKISYWKISDGINDLAWPSPKTLIDKGLVHPQGIAADLKRKHLFVADPDVRKIFAYQLEVNGDELLVTSDQFVVSGDAESRWVTVDSFGNVFFSDEAHNRIMKVSSHDVMHAHAKPEIVYSGESAVQVNKPGGIAADGFHVYWTNKLFGTEVGAVVKASEVPIRDDVASSLSILARNTVKSYGICLALGNIYFTDSDKYLYGVKKRGGPTVTVSDVFVSPRGCAWDGDGMVFVADRAANAVYSFPGNMHSISQVQVTKAFDFEDAFALAIISMSARRWHVLLAAWIFSLGWACAE